MTEYLLLFVGTVLVNNFVLVKFLGLCPFLGVSKKLESAIGYGHGYYLCHDAGLRQRLGDQHLYPGSVGSGVSALPVIYFGDRRRGAIYRDGGTQNQPALYRLLGIFLPLITTNCAVLGVALLYVNLGYNFLQSAVYGFSAAAGFSLVMVLFAAIRERLAVADVPAPFRGSSSR
jgi:electron transport complex protein RnfA